MLARHDASVPRAVFAFALPFLLLVPALRSMHRPGFDGDGVGYYAPLASILVDRDLDLRNEVAHLNPRFVRAAFMTPEGRLGNPFPVGPAVLWSPAVFLVRALPAMAWLDAPTDPPPRTSHAAFAPRFARAVFWSNLFWVLLGGAALSAALARTFHWAGSAVACLAVVFGSPLFYYLFVAPSYGHATSFAVVAAFTSAVLFDREHRLRLEILGFLVGLVALVRSQDVVLGLLLLPRLRQEWRAGTSVAVLRFARIGLQVLVPALLAFAPQMLFWQRIYGRPLLLPPGPDLGPLWRPSVLQFLFSTWNGVLVWTPLTLAGILGWAACRWRDFRFAAFAVLCVEIYLCSMLLDWWGGGSFGPRRLISMAPLAACGLAFALERLRRVRPALVAAGIVITVSCVSSVRLGQYTMNGLLDYNPSHSGRDPWDYPELWRGLARAERLLQARASQDLD